MSDIPASADIIVIGGGALGLSVAAHLGWRGAKDVLLLERHQLTSGTSWHAAGIIGPLRASLNLTGIAAYATKLFPRLDEETGVATGYRQTGGLWLAQTEDRMEELRRTADIGLLAGLGARVIDARDAVAAFPLLSGEGLAGALWVDEDGQADPVGICMAYTAAARAMGVRIVEAAEVRKITASNGAVDGVVLADGTRAACRKVVNCAGAWAHDLAAGANVAVPLWPVEHMYVTTEPIADLPRPTPVTRDLDARIYIKEDAGRIVLGGFEPDAKVMDLTTAGTDRPFLELPEDWDQFTPFMDAGLSRLPRLAETGIQHFMNGPESFTPDTLPVIGPVPELDGYWVAAGFNSLGIVSSAGVGRVMADWLVDGRPSADVVGLDIARFEPDMAAPAFLKARVQEAVATQFDTHWPHKRPVTGRDLLHLPAHDAWADAGAVFGAPGGWERPLWFGPEDGYAFGPQPWWPAAERECLAARDGAVAVDLSPFSKFEISGLVAAQHVFSADMDTDIGRGRYTLMLNGVGGIEAEATVTRLSEDRFLMTGAAPSRRRDLRWLRVQLGRDAVRDLTRDTAVLGLFGPKAGDIWQTLGGDRAALSQRFSTTAQWGLEDQSVTATRLSFIGEFGWEIACPWDKAHDLSARMLRAGAQPMGLLAVDACRHEKGFRHWGHDIGPMETPLQAGLGFTLGWETDFLGRAALEAERADGIKQTLAQFAVEDMHPFLHHDEPVLCNGEIVGHTTSAARGFRTGLSFCFAYLPSGVDGAFEIQVGGRRHPLRRLERPAYDPDGVRMRAIAASEEPAA